MLDKNDAICRGIWHHKNNFSSGITKISHYQNLAKKFLANEPEIQNLLTNSKAIKHYENAIKNHIT